MRIPTIALLMALSANAAFAASHTVAMMEDMNKGLSMLESSTALVLKEYGLEADVMSLSLSQLVEIQGVLSSMDTNAEKKSAIEAALRR